MSSDPRDESTPPGAIAVIRYTLTLSALAMLAMAALTFFQVLPFPRWISIMFLMVAFADVLIGMVILGSRRGGEGTR